jgi:hypothetical protein
MLLPCYKLYDKKVLSDGTEIPSDKKLFHLKNEDDILFLFYENENNDRIVFWARMEEVELLGEFEKEFDVNIDDIINGNYFDLI